MREMESTPSPNAECPGALPPDIIGRCLELLNPNDMAFHGCLVNKDACRRFSDPLHRTATFSIPLPEAATGAPWQQYMLQAFQQLTFVGKFMSLSVAAASGSPLNLELAWALLQPCVCLGYVHAYIAEDAGTAAVRFGHLHLLPWLLQHGCPTDKHSVLAAAAQHCDLGGMQLVWGLLVGSDSHPPSGRDIHARLAEAAGKSGTDAVAKLSWLLLVYKGHSPNPKLTEQEVIVAAAEGAAASGNLPVLRWMLHERDPNLCSNTLAEMWEEDGSRLPKWPGVLSAALRHGHVAVADWLVDQAGCPVLQRGQQEQQGGQQGQGQEAPWELRQLWHGAARGGSVVSMRWLLRRGVPVSAARLYGGALSLAVTSGRLVSVRFLHEECGETLQQNNVFAHAAGSGSVPLTTWLLQAGCPMSKGAYGNAALSHDVPMLRWLREVARCPWGEDTLGNMMNAWRVGQKSRQVGKCSSSGSSGDGGSGGSSSIDLEREARAMLEAGCPPGNGVQTTDIIGAAAACGLLPLVRHLREERGLAFASGTLETAAQGGCVPVVEWLVGAGCRTSWNCVLDDPYVAAAGGQGIADVATLSCLRRLGVPWNASVLLWALDRRVSLRVFRWMVEQGAPWDESTLRDVVGHWRGGGHGDEVVAWIAERLGVCGPVTGGGDVEQ